VETAVVGREAELAAIEEALAEGRSGFTALVLEGDAGIGKTAVWRAGFERATRAGYRVLSCRAVQSEARLSFTALADLLAPVEPGAFDALPEPQRLALDAALLRNAPAAGVAASPRAIGTGLVTLLSTLAAAVPVLVAIDDAQWLDASSARALEFAFRRLETRRVAVLATRRPGVPARSAILAASAGDRVRTRQLGPLSLAALYHIVAEPLGRRPPRPLLRRIERASGGNPFFALEIARALPAGGPAPGEELPIPGDLSQLVTSRLRKLPRRTHDALLRASALAQPTTSLVDGDALAPAEAAGVVRVSADGAIEFSHPLFASGVYAAASRERRRRLHAELAERAGSVEERARHLMLASPRDAADAQAADVLLDAAEHAARRGALDFAAELAERAAQLTPSDRDVVRQQRLLRAARLYLAAGDPDRSRALCDAVLSSAPASPIRAEALHVLAGASVIERPALAIPLLEEALACLGDEEHRAGQLEMALATARASVFDLAAASGHASRAAELAERVGDRALLAEAIATRELLNALRGQGADERALERALALEDVEREVPFQIRPSLSVAAVHAHAVRTADARRVLLRLRERLAARGGEAELPWLQSLLAITSWAAGELEAAEREATEAQRAAALTARELVGSAALVLRTFVRASRGDAAGVRSDATELLALSARMGWAHGLVGVRSALAHLALSEGAPETALAELAPILAVIERAGVYEFPVAVAVPDAIEAALATEDMERAARLTEALGAWGRRFDRPWALALSARCEALLLAAHGDLAGALAAATRALAAHERLAMPLERARTLLVQGQLQRRSGERRAARATLAESLALFERCGARLWAERARTELARIGVRRAPAELTEGEQRVAELAAVGLTNPEIAARLFMARRTVEANLARAYRKLEIRSRAELGVALARRKGSSPP
jgi:DNA-binding CsgD family transcriptional regulator